ncbi:MAG: DMT family transporter [Spirochaetia bacterium]
MDASPKNIPAAPYVVIIGVLFASFSSIIIRLSTAPPLIIAFYRMFFASAVLLPFFLKRVCFNREKASPSDVVRMIAGGFFLALHFAAWITSLGLTTVSSSVVLVSTHPVLVFFFSRLFFKERGTTAQFVYVVLAIVGSAVLSLGDAGRGETALSGNLLAFIGGMAVGFYLIVGRSVRKRHSLSYYTFFVYSTSAFFLFIYAALAESSFFEYPPREWILFLLLALMCTLLGHSLYNWSLKYLPGTFISVTILIEPIAASIMAFFLFSEIPTPVSGIGAALVLAGIYLYGRSTRRRTEEKSYR